MSLGLNQSDKLTHLKGVIMKQNKGGRPALGNTRLTPEKIKMAIKSTQSMGQARQYLGVSRNTFKKYAKQYNLWAPVSSSKGIRRSNIGAFKQDLKMILEGKNPNPYREDTLLQKGIKEGYLDCSCNNCAQDFKHIINKQPPLILDFLDKNPQNTKLDNLRVLCFNCIYTLSYTDKGWYRHRDTAIGFALDKMDIVTGSLHRETVQMDSPSSGTEVRAIPQDEEIEYLPFEEFQKLL